MSRWRDQPWLPTWAFLLMLGGCTLVLYFILRFFGSPHG